MIKKIVTFGINRRHWEPGRREGGGREGGRDAYPFNGTWKFGSILSILEQTCLNIKKVFGNIC
jgi:hypothetical protein